MGKNCVDGRKPDGEFSGLERVCTKCVRNWATRAT